MWRITTSRSRCPYSRRPMRRTHAPLTRPSTRAPSAPGSPQALTRPESDSACPLFFKSDYWPEQFCVLSISDSINMHCDRQQSGLHPTSTPRRYRHNLSVLLCATTSWRIRLCRTPPHHRTQKCRLRVISYTQGSYNFARSRLAESGAAWTARSRLRSGLQYEEPGTVHDCTSRDAHQAVGAKPEQHPGFLIRPLPDEMMLATK